MFEAICEHIKYSYNDGAIRPTITVFRKRQEGLPDFRVWNQLMIGFAGYSIEAHKKDAQAHFPGDENTTNKIGDQANLSFTKVIEQYFIWCILSKHFTYIFSVSNLHQNLSYIFNSSVNGSDGKAARQIGIIYRLFSQLMANQSVINF